MNIIEIQKYTNEELLKRFNHIIEHERKTTTSLVLYLSEVDRRKLYLKAGYPSLYAYLIDKYRYEGGSAYRRIQAARFIRKYPQTIHCLMQGKMSLTTMCLISPHITQMNQDNLIKAVLGKSKKEVEDLIQLRFGKKPEVLRDKIRLLPVFSEALESTSAGGGAKNRQLASPRQSEVPMTAHLIPQKEGGKSLEISSPHSGEDINTKKGQKEHRLVKVEFVASEVVAQKLRRAQDLLRHKYPEGKFEDIIHEALDLLLEKKDPLRHSERKARRISSRGVRDSSPSARKDRTRHIPEAIRRQVWVRDKGECQYKSSSGRRCVTQSGIELDHIRPFALGGRHTLDNLQLLCRGHNRWRSKQTFGDVVRDNPHIRQRMHSQ